MLTFSGASPSTLAGDEVRDSLDDVGARFAALLEREHDRRGRRTFVGAAERRLVGQREVHLGALDAAHPADRPFEFALERAAIVHALREVVPAPRRAVEQLEAGTRAVRQSVLRERDARLRDVALGDEDGRAALRRACT